MSDEFSDALAEAINRPAEDDDQDAAESVREEVDDGAQSGGGGDIDDDRPSQDLAPRVKYQQQLDARRQNAQANRDGWATEAQRRTDALTEAQRKHREARKATLEAGDDASLEVEETALQQVLDARSAVDEARRYAQTWAQDHDAVAQMPQMSEAEQAWIDRNPRFLTDDAFRTQAQRVMAQMRAEGLDTTSEPTLRKVDEQLRSGGRMSGGRRTPGAPAVHTDSRTERPGGETMTTAEAKFIRRLGYNPDDKRVQGQWGKSKANTRRIAQQRGM